MKLNREQIVNEIESLVKTIKATGGWVKNEKGEGWFNHEILSDALALIRELTEENERLEKKYKLADSEREANVKGFTETIASLRADTVRKMREMLNAERGYDYEWHYNSWWGETINQTAKELLEEDT